MQQLKQRPRPKVPQRTQQRRKQRKEHRRADGRREQRVEPQLAPAETQREYESGDRQKQTEHRIQRAGERAVLAPPQAKGAEQIVHQRQRHAEQDGREQRPRLFADDRPHPQPPKMRENSPPRMPPASS